jgi:hypothetical protein
MAKLLRGKIIRTGINYRRSAGISEMTRRITAIILLESDLDDNYQNIKTAGVFFLIK